MSYKQDLQKRKIYIFIVSIALILQSGLRHVSVGADTYAYFLKFENVKLMGWSEILETFKNYYLHGEGKDPGYFVFQKLIQMFTNDYQIFLILIAIIFFTSFGYFVYRNTTELSDIVFAYILYLALFYSFFSITGIRQTVATAITLVSFELIKKKKFLPFLLLILIASTIHKSVLVFIPFYFIYKVKKPNKYIILLLISMPILYIFKESINNLFINVSGYEQYGLSETAGGALFSFLLIVVGVFSIWRFRYLNDGNSSSYKFYNALFLALLFLPLLWVNPNSMRIIQYFSLFLTITVPDIIRSFKNPKSDQVIVYISSILFLLILSISTNFNSNYLFFWQN